MHVLTSPIVRAAVVALLAAGVARPAVAQGKDSKQKDYERKELQAVYLLLDQAITRQVPEGLSLFNVDPSKKGAEGIAKAAEATPFMWYNDALRAGDGKTYVPFMAFLDQAQVPPGGNVAYGVRVVPRGTTTPTEAKDGKAPAYPWEDLNFAVLRSAPEVTGKSKLVRVFQVPGGAYDVYIALRPHALEKTKETPYKAMVLRQSVTLPDLGQELTTSSVLVLDKIEPATQAAGTDTRENPWVMGSLAFVPSIDRKFEKTDNFGVYFQIYNQTAESGKPDVTIEYNFFRKEGAEEKYFNKTAPQHHNAKTLPAEWNAQAGHLVSGGIEIPLASFTPGDYRLEVKVTDNLAKRTITRDVTFTVTGA